MDYQHIPLFYRFVRFEIFCFFHSKINFIVVMMIRAHNLWTMILCVCVCLFSLHFSTIWLGVCSLFFFYTRVLFIVFRLNCCLSSSWLSLDGFQSIFFLPHSHSTLQRVYAMIPRFLRLMLKTVLWSNRWIERLNCILSINIFDK